MSLVLDGEHAVGPSLLALLTQKILMWGPTVGVIIEAPAEQPAQPAEGRPASGVGVGH